MFFGQGILRGMAITLKNFVGSYFRKPGETGAVFTVQYPEERLPEKHNFRNFPFLVYDEDPANPRCTACDICAKECPPKCIYIVRDTTEDGKPLKRPAVFDIDLTVCMNCGICEESCPFDSIYMDHEFEIAEADRQEKLLYHRDDLLKPNSYFHKIRPRDATEIDARRKEAEEKKKAKAAAKPATPPPPAGGAGTVPPPPAARPTVPPPPKPKTDNPEEK